MVHLGCSFSFLALHICHLPVGIFSDRGSLLGVRRVSSVARDAFVGDGLEISSSTGKPQITVEDHSLLVARDNGF